MMPRRPGEQAPPPKRTLAQALGADKPFMSTQPMISQPLEKTIPRAGNALMGALRQADAAINSPGTLSQPIMSTKPIIGQPLMSTEPLERSIPRAGNAFMAALRQADDYVNSYLAPSSPMRIQVRPSVPTNAPDMTGGPPVPMRVSTPDMAGEPPAPSFASPPDMGSAPSPIRVAMPAAGSPPSPVRVNAPLQGSAPAPMRVASPDTGMPPAPMTVNAPDMTGQPPAPQFNRSSPVSPTPQTPGQAMRQPTPQVRGTDNAMKRAQQGAPPAPPTPTRGILKPGATPTVANLLEDVRAGVNDSGTIGLDRLTGAPMSVVQMQNQGRDIANQIVDESITRRALTDPRSLSPENRTGIAPINLMAEMDRRAEMETERQAMQQRGAEWRATRPTSEQLRALQQSDREANAAMNLAKFGQRESPYQQRKAAERAEDRQRMRERMKQFEDIKYARIAMNRYGMAPTEELSLRAAMGAAPETGMQFMAQKDLNQARRDVARMQTETNKLKINTDRETQLKLKEMDNEARLEENAIKKMAAEGVIKEAEANQRLAEIQAKTLADQVGVLMEQARGQSQVGAAQAFATMMTNPAIAGLIPPQALRGAIGSMAGMMTGQAPQPGLRQQEAMNPGASIDVGMMEPSEIGYQVSRTESNPVFRKVFPDLSDPSSIAWSIGGMMRNGAMPTEATLQELSDYVGLQKQYNPAFMQPTNRLFGTLGGDYSIYDDVINAPPGRKQEAYANAQNRVYADTGRLGLFPRIQMPQQPPVQMQRPIAPVIPVAPPMQQGRGIFDDASYMQMTEQQLRQGGF